MSILQKIYPGNFKEDTIVFLYLNFFLRLGTIFKDNL